jgi:hypothetical protein
LANGIYGSWTDVNKLGDCSEFMPLDLTPIVKEECYGVWLKLKPTYVFKSLSWPMWCNAWSSRWDRYAR